MQIDSIAPIYPAQTVPAQQDVTSLSGVATKVQPSDSGNPPVQPVAAVQSGDRGSTAVTTENKNEVKWSDDPPMAIYQVVNSEGSVVYQYPSSEVVDLAKNITSAIKSEGGGPSTFDERS
jgi:hypothetical protein